MNATTLDLRYKTHDVLRSLDRGESVIITFRGKPKGIIEPYCGEKTEKVSVTDHPFFGMCANADESVEDTMSCLRGGRYNDL